MNTNQDNSNTNVIQLADWKKEDDEKHPIQKTGEYDYEQALSTYHQRKKKQKEQREQNNIRTKKNYKIGKK